MDNTTTIQVTLTNKIKRSVIKQVITVEERRIRYDYIHNRPTNLLERFMYRLDYITTFIKSIFDKNNNADHDIIKELYADEEAYNESMFPTIRKDVTRNGQNNC